MQSALVYERCRKDGCTQTLAKHPSRQRRPPTPSGKEKILKDESAAQSTKQQVRSAVSLALGRHRAVFSALLGPCAPSFKFP